MARAEGIPLRWEFATSMKCLPRCSSLATSSETEPFDRDGRKPCPFNEKARSALAAGLAIVIGACVDDLGQRRVFRVGRKMMAAFSLQLSLLNRFGFLVMGPELLDPIVGCVARRA